ncbi:hypothetical protein TNCV_3490761 [Trichonephila clavipes]|nr:hypothetical protein TNCV_3490761 [Trichonephila clavipes]
MVGRHILEDIVGRVAQYVDEHYPVDKWHLGDLIAWVAQSALKYRPRICELSKCLEGPLKMIVCPIAPHTVTPCEIAVCRSTINAGSDRWPVRLQTRVRWSSSLRLNRDSSLKMTRLQSVTLQVARGRQNPVDTAYDVGSVVSVLADVGSSSQLRDVVGAEVATLLIARSSRSFVFLGRPDPLRRYTLPSVIHCCQHRATTISLRRWRPIRLFDQPASLRPNQSPSAARTAAGYVLEAS